MTVFGAHIWRRDPPCAQHRNKEYLLHSLLTIESPILPFHGMTLMHLKSSQVKVLPWKAFSCSYTDLLWLHSIY